MIFGFFSGLHISVILESIREDGRVKSWLGPGGYTHLFTHTIFYNLWYINKLIRNTCTNLPLLCPLSLSLSSFLLSFFFYSFFFSIPTSTAIKSSCVELCQWWTVAKMPSNHQKNNVAESARPVLLSSDHRRCIWNIQRQVTLWNPCISKTFWSLSLYQRCLSPQHDTWKKRKF